MHCGKAVSGDAGSSPPENTNFQKEQKEDDDALKNRTRR
jgi:hypothetical protein